MADISINRSTLPAGWYYPTETEAQSLHAELPPGHLLSDSRSRRLQDDVLFRHLDESDRFTVVHLTWIRKQEMDAKHPSVCFDGTFERFFAEEERFYNEA